MSETLAPTSEAPTGKLRFRRVRPLFRDFGGSIAGPFFTATSESKLILQQEWSIAQNRGAETRFEWRDVPIADDE